MNHTQDQLEELHRLSPVPKYDMSEYFTSKRRKQVMKERQKDENRNDKNDTSQRWL